jgi:hypothetical protein
MQALINDDDDGISHDQPAYNPDPFNQGIHTSTNLVRGTVQQSKSTSAFCLWLITTPTPPY